MAHRLGLSFPAQWWISAGLWGLISPHASINAPFPPISPVSLILLFYCLFFWRAFQIECKWKHIWCMFLMCVSASVCVCVCLCVCVCVCLGVCVCVLACVCVCVCVCALFIGPCGSGGGWSLWCRRCLSVRGLRAGVSTGQQKGFIVVRWGPSHIEQTKTQETSYAHTYLIERQ